MCQPYESRKPNSVNMANVKITAKDAKCLTVRVGKNRIICVICVSGLCQVKNCNECEKIANGEGGWSHNSAPAAYQHLVECEKKNLKNLDKMTFEEKIELIYDGIQNGSFCIFSIFTKKFELFGKHSDIVKHCCQSMVFRSSCFNVTLTKSGTFNYVDGNNKTKTSMKRCHPQQCPHPITIGTTTYCGCMMTKQFLCYDSLSQLMKKRNRKYNCSDDKSNFPVGIDIIKKGQNSQNRKVAHICSDMQCLMDYQYHAPMKTIPKTYTRKKRGKTIEETKKIPDSTLSKLLL